MPSWHSQVDSQLRPAAGAKSLALHSASAPSPPLGLTQLPVIAHNAGVLPNEQRLIRAAGADEVLAESLDLEQLVATLLRFITAARRDAAPRSPVRTWPSSTPNWGGY